MNSLARFLYKKDMLDDESREVGQLLYILLFMRSGKLEFASGFLLTDIDIRFQGQIVISGQSALITFTRCWQQ